MLRTLAVCEHQLSQLLADQDDAACRDHYRAAYDAATTTEPPTTSLPHRRRPAQAICARQLGNAYRTVSRLRDLDQAQHWFERNLALTPEHSRIGRAATNGNLTAVAYDRS